jgi:large subunit ribosomal protein L11
MIIKLLVDGGSMKPGPTISQKLGPLGINIGKVISDVNEATKNFDGIKVPVELDIDAKSKSFKVNVLSPPISELLKKELSIEKASGSMKKVKVGNLSIEQIIKVTKIKHANMLAKSTKSAVKTVLGSCVSLGIMVENKEAKEIIVDIDNGVYDKEIKAETTETSPDKLKELKDYFTKIKSKQDEVIKKELEEKAAAEAEKQTATTSATGVGSTAVAPAGKEAAAKTTAKPAAKPAAKK